MKPAAAERKGFERGAVQVARHCPSRHHGNSEIRLHHLYNGLGQFHAGRPCWEYSSRVEELIVDGELAQWQRISDKVLLREVAWGEITPACQAMLRAQDRHQFVVEQRPAGDGGLVGRTGNNRQVKLAG